MENIVGKAFEELSLEEMALSQGSGEIQPRTSVGCVVASVVASSGWCGVGAVVGSLAAYSIKHC